MAKLTRIISALTGEVFYVQNLDVKQTTGQSEEDVMSQKAVTDELNGKAVPDGAYENMYAGLSGNLKSWADRAELAVQDSWQDKIRTTAGDTSIVSSRGGKLVSIIPLSNYRANYLFSYGFNLLTAGAYTQSRDLFYFPVPKLTFSAFGSADTPNGILFTNASHENVKPAVYFKPASQGAPMDGSYGTLATYVDSNGYRFYTCSEEGYFTILTSEVNVMGVCAHLAWSSRYDEYVPTESFTYLDRIIIGTPINAVHGDDELYFVNTNARDYIEFGDTTAKWHRVCDKVQVLAANAIGTQKWTDTPNEVQEGGTQTYTHSTNLANIKPYGAARLADGTILNVDDTMVSYVDTNATAATAYVYYELVTPVTGSVTIDAHYDVDDWGIEMISGAYGKAIITTSYAQGYPDSLAAIANTKFPTLAARVAEQEEEIEELTSELLESQNNPDMKYGQPRLLFGAGTPQASVVPDNWIQLADGGYDWNGYPAFVGQQYINTASATGGYWIAYKKTDYTLAWRQIVG